MKYGYARASPGGKSESVDARARQRTKAGCKKVCRDSHVSGAKTDRAQLRRVNEALQPGDVVTVTRIDRLARSNLFAIVKQIVDLKAHFPSLAEPWADTGTSTGRLMNAVLGELADAERGLIRARAATGNGNGGCAPSSMAPANSTGRTAFSLTFIGALDRQAAAVIQRFHPALPGQHVDLVQLALVDVGGQEQID